MLYHSVNSFFLFNDLDFYINIYLQKGYPKGNEGVNTHMKLSLGSPVRAQAFCLSEKTNAVGLKTVDAFTRP